MSKKPLRPSGNAPNGQRNCGLRTNVAQTKLSAPTKKTEERKKLQIRAKSTFVEARPEIDQFKLIRNNFGARAADDAVVTKPKGQGFMSRHCDTTL